MTNLILNFLQHISVQVFSKIFHFSQLSFKGAEDVWITFRLPPFSREIPQWCLIFQWSQQNTGNIKKNQLSKYVYEINLPWISVMAVWKTNWLFFHRMYQIISFTYILNGTVDFDISLMKQIIKIGQISFKSLSIYLSSFVPPTSFSSFESGESYMSLCLQVF